MALPAGHLCPGGQAPGADVAIFAACAAHALVSWQGGRGAAVGVGTPLGHLEIRARGCKKAAYKWGNDTARTWLKKKVGPGAHRTEPRFCSSLACRQA